MKNKFNLYMMNREYDDFRECLTDSALEQLVSGRASAHEPTTFPRPSILYVFQGWPNPPAWQRVVGPEFRNVNLPSSTSAAGLIFFSADDRTFAVSYGYGWMYINESKIESDFGLKVSVNSTDPTKLKNLERSNLGASVRNFSQTPWHGRLQDLGFEATLDIIRKMTGSSNVAELGDQTTGSKALKISVEGNVADVVQIAGVAKGLFESEFYKSTEFKVIDFLRPISSPAQVAELDNLLVESIKNGGEEFEIMSPQILAEDYSYFKVLGKGRGKEYPVINAHSYIEAWGEDIDEIEIQNLKSHKIAVFSDANDSPISQWSVYRCIVGSVEHGGVQYAINEGSWYSVDDAFNRSAVAAYNDRLVGNDDRFGPLIKTLVGKNKVHLEAEADYLQRTADGENLFLMDQKFVHAAGLTRGRGVEVCDLLDVEQRKLIHVKKGSTTSSVLSHLFQQGLNSAKLLRMHSDFRREVARKIGENNPQLAARFADQIGDATGWSVEFRIADSVRSSGEHNIPFFSKLSFKDVAQVGEAMGFEFRLGYITIPRDLRPSGPSLISRV